MAPLPVVGIDLGTTYSCVGCLKNNRIEIIANDQGERTTPSIVAYIKNSTEIVVGTPATHQLSRNAENTFYDSKRIIGKFFGDPTIGSDIEKFPFEIIQNPESDKSGEAVFKVTNGHIFENNSEKTWVSPQEVAADVLKTLKASAEAFIGSPVRHAVITVPAYFNNEQRKATKQAGELAGLNVLQLLNEPTAAALAYGEYGDELMEESTQKEELSEEAKQPKTILVFDLGGGTFDVSLLKFKDHDYEVLAVDGDNHLGGEDFTNRMADHLLKEFAEQVGASVEELSQNTRVVRRLRDQCEKSKRVLSSSQSAMIEIENLLNDHDFYTSISRSQLDEMCKDLFARLERPINTVLEISNTAKSEVKEIVLIGGSTRMQKVREIICQYFNNIELKETVNADEAVASGATIMAVKLAKDRIEELDDEYIQKHLQTMSLNNNVPHSNLVLREVTPMSITIEVYGGITSAVIIPKNTEIPATGKITLVTSDSYQTTLTSKILEGESPLAEKNNLLGCFSIKNLTPRPRGQTRVFITMTIDLDGIMKVSGYEVSGVDSTGAPAYNATEQEVVIENVTNSLNMEERLRMIQSYENDKTADEIECRRREAMVDLTYTLDDEVREASEAEGPLSTKEQEILNELKEAQVWLEQATFATRSEYLAKRDKVLALGQQFRETQVHRVSKETKKKVWKDKLKFFK